MEKNFFVCVELGGQSVKTAIFPEDSKITTVKEMDKYVSVFKKKGTESPKDFIERIVDYSEVKTKGKISVVGIASFGPIDLHPNSKDFGKITTTPKTEWQNTDVVGPFKRRFGEDLLFAFDTDVNSPALFESRHHNIKNVAYITVGTGIGVGVVVNGEPIHGLIHPEGGHCFVRIHEKDKDFPGVCPFHGNCLEGLCCSEAIGKRANVPREEIGKLKEDHLSFQLSSYYLSQLCCDLLLLLSLERIIFGGGIMNNSTMIQNIQKTTKEMLNGYLKHPKIIDRIEEIIVQSDFHPHSGIFGAMELCNKKKRSSMVQKQ